MMYFVYKTIILMKLFTHFHQPKNLDLFHQSGGGAFLVPYILFLLTCGLPLFFMEISCGQFASLSPITVWKMSPLFRGKLLLTSS